MQVANLFFFLGLRVRLVSEISGVQIVCCQRNVQLSGHPPNRPTSGELFAAAALGPGTATALENAEYMSRASASRRLKLRAPDASAGQQ